jgi:hypothetical protein
MASPDDIAGQQNLLVLHRRTLAVYLGQLAALGGTAHAPPHVANGILEARANIQHVKGILREWGQPVEDHPDDEPPAPPEHIKPAQSDSTAAIRAPKRASRRTEQYANDVFISYSKVDRAWVRGTLAPRLERAGLTVIIGERDFELGVPKLINIERAVEGSRHTLLVLTPAWCESEWAEFDSLLSGTADPAARRRKLIPLMLQPCQPPARIETLEPADFTQPAEHEWQLDRLIRSLLQGRTAGSPSRSSNKQISETAPATTPTGQPTTQIGRDQVNVQESPGAITGRAGAVSQNFGEQNTTNAGTVIHIHGGDFQGANLGFGNTIGRDLSQTGGQTTSAFIQHGWNVQGNVYNMAGNLNMSANPSKDEFIAALQQLKDELAKAKDLPADEASDLKGNLDDAIEAAERPQPNKERTLKKLTAMKEIVDGLKDNAGSALALGHLIGQAAQAAHKLVF